MNWAISQTAARPVAYLGRVATAMTTVHPTASDGF